MRVVRSILLAAPLTLVAAAIPAAALPDQAEPGVSHAPVCASVPAGRARCHAHVVAPDGRPRAQTTSYGASDLRTAYGFAPTTASATALASGPTVAIVDAYDAPDVAAHLAAYRQTMGEPLCADGTVSCFFTKYDERGSTGSQATYPAANSSWAQEIDLDVQMVSALCQSCRIALVEADSNGYTDLGLAVDAAANVPGVVAISNSYGGSEISAELSVASHYSHPGIAITVSTGDNGYGVEWPAAASTVLAVGGTTLSKTNTGWTESAWSGAGSGCSAYVSKPSWQLNLVTSCAGRMVADVAAVADPNTGVRVYTTGSTGSGWYVMGGTSVASPIVATVAALSGVPSSTKDGSGLYLKAQHLFDVVSGSNGKCTSGKTSTAGAALCTAGAGWDGPTGNGSPRGPIAL